MDHSSHACIVQLLHFVLQAKDLRIIVALFTPHHPLARRVWCEVSGGASKLDPLGSDDS